MRTTTCRNWGGLVIVISLFAALLLVPANAAAQSRSGTAEEHVKVVAHMELPGMHVNGMFVQHRDDRDYLYLHRPTRKAFAVVDVTKAQKPVLVERETLSEPVHTRVEVSAVEPLLAIAVGPEDNAAGRPSKTNSANDPSSTVLPTETVRLLDLSDPQHPKTLKTFTGVTSFLPDDARRLIYIVNQEGLWIVSHRQSRPMPFCTSADALTQQPNCQ